MAEGSVTWPLFSTIARSHEKGLLVLMGDGKGSVPGDALRKMAKLSLLFTSDPVLTDEVQWSFDGRTGPGQSLTVGTQSSRRMLQRFFHQQGPLETVPVSYARPSSEEIALEIDAGEEPAIVFISEAFHPGWRAYLDGGIDRDGEEIPVLRAQLAFMAIPVAGGRHTIRLRFTPPRGVRLAETISWASWLALPVAAVGWLVAGRQRRSATSQPASEDHHQRSKR